MSVQIYDTLGQPLDASVLKFIKLKPVLGSSIVRVKAVEGLEHIVEGAALGETTIAFSTPAVRSSVINVQVFAPLRISPRNVTLVLGATLQVVRNCHLSSSKLVNQLCSIVLPDQYRRTAAGCSGRVHTGKQPGCFLHFQWNHRRYPFGPYKAYGSSDRH